MVGAVMVGFAWEVYMQNRMVIQVEKKKKSNDEAERVILAV
jgi:hypothetical protein